MRSKPCPSCGATAVPEARFCRLCGAPLKTGSALEGEAPISPLAQTVPLHGEGRATDGLSADDERGGASKTSRVDRAEIENMLRRVEADYAGDGEGKKEQDKRETAAPQTTALAPKQITQSQPSDATPSSSSATKAAQPSQNLRSRRMWTFAAIALLCVALVAVVLAFVLLRKSGSTDSGSAQPISISDQKQLVNEKLAEAETLLEAGEFNHAIEVLRAALKLDPSNTEAHIRLGNALERTGSRTEAIEEYKAAAQNNPNDISAWRALASAQAEEKLYNDAAESYRHLLAVSGNSLDDETWLAYGDALRLAGRADEARTAYQKISASGSAAIAQAARRHLSEIGPPAVVVNTEHSRETRTTEQQAREPEVVAPQAQPTPTPLARATPAVATGANPVDYDSYYFQALNVVNGRDPKKMERAELLHALALFQRASQGGTHRTEAQRYADKLGKEYDRRRKQG